MVTKGNFISCYVEESLEENHSMTGHCKCLDASQYEVHLYIPEPCS